MDDDLTPPPAVDGISDREICLAVASYQANPYGKLFSYDYLQLLTGRSEDDCYAALENAAFRNLIEYGVSLRTGWLTDKGKALLADHR